MEAQQTTTSPLASSKDLVYTTRFGEVTLREDRLISFPQGVLGFGDCTVFGLSRLPNADESPLMLLQCVNDTNVSFLVGDPSVLGLEIKEKDLQLAFKETKMPEKDTQVMVILTLYDQEDSYFLTANLKAPILIDSVKRVACQHILVNSEYSTQQKI